MEIFNVNRYAIGLTPKINLNNSNRNIYFKQNEINDSFVQSSAAKYFNEEQIRSLIAQNPEIKEILAQNNIPLKLNMTELIELKENHCRDTQEIASAIVRNIPPMVRQHLKIDLKDLKDAALLHDFGKVLIPQEILNKTDKLTSEEQKIMALHSELGYQLLKNTGLNDEVLKLIRYHHDNVDKNGNFIPDVNLQILNLADKYSALTEKRVYKDEFSPERALTIIYSDVKKGNVDPQLFNALVKTVHSSQNIPIVNKY